MEGMNVNIFISRLGETDNFFFSECNLFSALVDVRCSRRRILPHTRKGKCRDGWGEREEERDRQRHAKKVVVSFVVLCESA